MKKKLLYLTNLENGDPEEDLYLAEHFKKVAQVVLSHPLQCRPLLADVDGIIIRNAWPTHAYKDEWLQLIDTFAHQQLRTYNPLSGKGDMHGKSYVEELFLKDFPVIPTVLSAQHLDRLSPSEFYWTKPIWGCDGSGAAKMTRSELLERSPQNTVIQPFVKFCEEPSAFFIDNEFAYGIKTTHRLNDLHFQLWHPSADEIELAKRFVEWNKLPYGLQRIDFVRLETGKLLLTEIEDNCPFLYLLDIPEKERLIIIEKLVNSAVSNLGLGI